MEKDKMIVHNTKGEVSSVHTSEILGHVYFGRELKISPKSDAILNKPGFKSEYNEETVSVLIGIGKDHVAELIMTRSAWEAFVSGEKVDITTVKQFAAMYIKKKKK
jgi:hypothetical protein